nr:uncharacterized protein LOC127325979 isoform X3 [Lolium perenne]
MLQPATTSPDLLPTCAGNILGGWTCCSRRAPSTSLSRCCLPERLDGPDTEKSRAAVDYLALADLWEHFAESSAYGLAVLVRLLGHVLPLRHPAIHSHQPHHLQEKHGECNGFLEGCWLAGLLVVAAGHACGAPGCGRRPCSRGSWWWPLAMPAGLQVVAAVFARGAPGGGRPSNKDNKGGQTMWLSAPPDTARGIDGGRPGVVVASPGCCSRRPPPLIFSPRAPATSLEAGPAAPAARHPPLCPAAASQSRNAWMGRTRRRVELRWTTWRWLTCGSTLLRAAHTASLCSSASLAMSYLSAIQLYTATSLTISRQSNGSSAEHFLTANFRIRFRTNHWFIDPCLQTHALEEHGERNGFLHSIRNLSSYHIPVAAVYGSASA